MNTNRLQAPLNKPSNAIKKAVANNFSKAAQRYDKKARIQQRISDYAVSQVARFYQQNDWQWQSLVDIGCATGRVTNQLQPYCQQTTGIDLSPGMIQFANQQSKNVNSEGAWLVGDAEDLPLPDNSQDFVFSCMALQWLSSPEIVARECFRIISEKGEGLLAVMVDGSLWELTHCWRTLQVNPPVNRFISADNWLKSFENVGFQCELRVETFTDFHDSVFSLLHSIKDIGAGLIVHAGQTEQINKSKLISLNEAYKSHYQREDKLPLSYKVAMLHIKKQRI